MQSACFNIRSKPLTCSGIFLCSLFALSSLFVCLFMYLLVWGLLFLSCCCLFVCFFFCLFVFFGGGEGGFFSVVSFVFLCLFVCALFCFVCLFLCMIIKKCCLWFDRIHVLEVENLVGMAKCFGFFCFVLFCFVCFVAVGVFCAWRKMYPSGPVADWIINKLM